MVSLPVISLVRPEQLTAFGLLSVPCEESQLPSARDDRAPRVLMILIAAHRGEREGHIRRDTLKVQMRGSKGEKEMSEKTVDLKEKRGRSDREFEVTSS